MIKKIVICLLIGAAFSSCTSEKKILYFQNINTLSSETKRYEPKLQPDDLLMINVSSSDPEAAAPFNLPIVATMGTSLSTLDVVNSQIRYQTYLVNNEGSIVFPVIGNFSVAGLTKAEAHIKLTNEIKKYIKDPVVNIRIMNYKVSVMGEVLRPGEFNVVTERITLLEALSLCGDLTIYANRKDITVIRELNGVKTYNVIDITSVDFFKSDFYYLSQNDLVYVRPNKTKVNSSVIGPNTTVIISSVSLLITVIALLTR